MTTLQHQLTSGLSGTTNPFEFDSQKIISRSSTTNIIQVEVKPLPIPVKNSVSIDDLVNEFESDKEIANLLSKSRKRFSEAIYVNKPETLSKLRLSAGLSQDQLAQKSGTSQSHIAKIESARNDPGTDVIQKIAKALSVDPARVFNAISNQRINES